LLLRLIQSDGQISRESTTVRGSQRSTMTARRTGTPTVLTTTTQDRVFADDETRFLSVWADETPSQTLAVLKAKATKTKAMAPADLETWRKAMSLLKIRKHDFGHPPAWLQYVAEQLPLQEVKTRREWERCLGFFKAVALCRRSPDPDQVLDITFADYCTAYRILEPALRASMPDILGRHQDLKSAVGRLHKDRGRAVTADEIADELNWKIALVYKHLTAAVRLGLVMYEPETREKNQKRVLPTKATTPGFLPSPWKVFKNNPEIGPEARYVDPLTGKRKVLRREERERA